MHNIKLKITLASAFVILCAISAAHGQLAYNGNLRVNMPHDFIVNGTSYAAGEYTFGRMSGIRDPATMLVMRGPNGQTKLFDTIMHSSPFGYSQTDVVLKNVDGQYFLSKIRLEGQYTGYEFPMSRTQRQLIARARAVRDVVVTSDSEL